MQYIKYQNNVLMWYILISYMKYMFQLPNMYLGSNPDIRYILGFLFSELWGKNYKKKMLVQNLLGKLLCATWHPFLSSFKVVEF